MKKIIVLFLALSLALIGSAAPVSAAEDKPSNYLALKGGMIELQEIDDIGDDISIDLDTDTGWGGQLALGHYFTPFLAIELEGGYYKIDNSRESERDLGKIELELYPVLTTLKVLFPIGFIEPYIEAGGGAYFSRLDVKSDLLDVSWESDTETNWGLHAGGGLNINLPANFFLGAEGRALWVRADWGEDDVDIDGYSVAGVLGFRF